MPDSVLDLARQILSASRRNSSTMTAPTVSERLAEALLEAHEGNDSIELPSRVGAENLSVSADSLAGPEVVLLKTKLAEAEKALENIALGTKEMREADGGVFSPGSNRIRQYASNTLAKIRAKCCVPDGYHADRQGCCRE